MLAVCKSQLPDLSSLGRANSMSLVHSSGVRRLSMIWYLNSFFFISNGSKSGLINMSYGLAGSPVPAYYDNKISAMLCDKVRCEIGGTKSINIETSIGHSTGISYPCYRPRDHDLLEDCLKVADLLAISGQYRLGREIAKLRAQSDQLSCTSKGMHRRGYP
jgi:hypothetical protein